MTEWTDRDDAILRRMWLQGMPAAVIGENLGRTRNAIIGRAGRIGLPPHSKKVKPIPDKVLKVPPSKAVRVQSCQWPHGHPDKPDFHLCGAVPVPGKPYCLEHCQRAYRKEHTDERR